MRMINQLLDVARIESGSVPLQLERVSPEELLSAAVLRRWLWTTVAHGAKAVLLRQYRSERREGRRAAGFPGHPVSPRSLSFDF